MHTPLADAHMTETDLLGAAIYGPDDYEIGTVAGVHAVGSSMQVIVEVVGCMGTGRRTVAFDIAMLKFLRDGNGTVHATARWTTAEVCEMPRHDP